MKAKVFIPIIIISFTIALAFHFIALAAIDAPHNESNNVNCGSCHGQGLLDSPFWGGSMSYDQLCLNCHTASSGPYTETNAPLVKTHSSENTSENYGTWSWECRNCHDPHYQKQKNYKNTDASDLYLATGTIINCVDNGNGTSTLTYSSITYKTDWEATRLLEKTSEYRRVILFPNLGKLGYSYPVIGIDEGAQEITVLGDATPVYQYISTSTFAMMYGQYIKDSIESSQVKMVDRKWTSSFADGDGTYDGVCEICHTQTLYHRNDGSGISHYPSEKCTTCHLHMDGFADTEHTGNTGADCEGCHGHDDGWNGGSYYGTTISHSTHTENDSDDLKGPNIPCYDCHNTSNYPEFADGAPTLAATTVCDRCHSPGGTFDGVNDADIGAKNNWNDGVYASPTLKSGKEKWCASCHDDAPAYSQVEITTIIIDNPDAEFVGTWSFGGTSDMFGPNLRYKDAGTGTDTATWVPNIPRTGNYSVYAWWSAHSNRATDSPYTIYYDGGSETIRVNQEVNGGKWNYLGTYPFTAGTSGYIVLSDDANETVIADAVAFVRGDNKPTVYAPNIVGDNSTYGFYATGHGRTIAMNCLSCHDVSHKHIDHDHRTYEYNEGVGVVNPYCESYRLRDVDGLPALKMPSGRGGIEVWRWYALCFDCHNRYEVLNTTISDYSKPHTTNFWDASYTYGNAHRYHICNSRYDSDWDLDTEPDSYTSCPACHNVHGSPSKVMIRHGELISSPGTTDKVPALDFSYLKPSIDPIATATWTPDFSEAGYYGVYAWWADYYGRAPNAKYTIYYDGSSESVEKNQKIDGGQWNLLGTYNFTAGTSGYVVLSTEDAMGSIIADAVGFDTDGDSTPDIIIDNDDPEAVFVGEGWYLASHQTDKYGADLQTHPIPTYSYDYNTTLENSVGGKMRHRGSKISDTYVCGTCHGPSEAEYVRKPNVRPRILIRQVEPSWVDNNGTDQVLLAAYVYSPKGNLTGVTIDLSSIDGSATQVMYDDGTNGDVTAGDNLYSYMTTVPPSASSGLKTLTVTGTDGDGLTGSRGLTLMVANPGWFIVDNQDVVEASFRGIWDYTDEGGVYYQLRANIKNGSYSSARATWTPAISQAGNYNVYASWYAGANRATNAPYTIKHSSGSEIVRVNQQESGRQFVYLGTYYFDAQTRHTAVIVDNEDAEFVGSWGWSSHNLTQYGSSVHSHDPGTGANTATFTPDLPQAGNYEVYAWWTPNPNRASDAPYTINYSGGSATVDVNQEKDGGYFMYLGTYYFESGTGGSVVLSDDANQNVIADAIKFQLVEDKQNVVLKDDADGRVMADAILFEPVP